MKIHTFDQYSPEWWAARAGKVTASEAGPFLHATGKVAEGARRKLIGKKLAEMAGMFEDVRPNDAMKRGTALEPFAREEYARLMGVDVQQVGFIEHDTHHAGCSPDGLILREDGGILRGLEIKCPSAGTHVRYVIDGALPDDYRHQVHFSMAITGAEEWDFFSFCPKATIEPGRDEFIVHDIQPGLPPLLVRVRRDRLTDDLAAAIAEFSAELDTAKAQMAAIYAAGSVLVL